MKIKTLFNIQKSLILPDFCYESIRAIEYQNWLYPGEYGIATGDDNSAIPIGSLEFVFAMGIKYGQIDKPPSPLNVPFFLNDPFFTRRKIWKNIKNAVEIPDRNHKLFIKSAINYKKICDIIPSESLEKVIFEHGILDVSEVVEFTDEWRAFVFRGELKDLRCYTGLFQEIPDRGLLSDVIRQMSLHLPECVAYTVDLGILGSGQTALIEVHPFVSCGLYGFKDYGSLLAMFVAGYRFFCQGKDI